MSKIDIENALEIIDKFKGDSLQSSLNDIESNVGDLDNSSTYKFDFELMFNAAIIIKKASAQINEVVHASGIINYIKRHEIDKKEQIEYLSLGAGSIRRHFDLETDKRIAEFKFGTWQSKTANGVRKRSYLSNYIELLIKDEKEKERKKYFIMEDTDAFIKFLDGRSKWRNKLSKNPTVYKKFEAFLEQKGLENIETVSEIYHQFHGEVIIEKY